MKTDGDRRLRVSGAKGDLRGEQMAAISLLAAMIVGVALAFFLFAWIATLFKGEGRGCLLGVGTTLVILALVLFTCEG